MPFNVSEFYAKCVWMSMIKRRQLLSREESEEKVKASLQSVSHKYRVPVYSYKDKPKLFDNVAKAWRTVKVRMQEIL